MSESALQ